MTLSLYLQVLRIGYEALGDERFEFLCVVPNAPDRIEVLEDSRADLSGC